MTPEQWQQVDELFHSALSREPAQRAAFLDQACSGDELVLREVQSLISFHGGSASFIETPASDIAAELLRKNRRLEAGQRISHYKVLSSLGAGGMGEVYLAEDTRLGRRIALKLLPARFTTDAERVRRFDQEARAASALNHPNIVTIHEIGQADSMNFIATELIEGETLREKLASRTARLDDVLDIGIQVASSLAAAHAAGIVHRDIKPENIMVRGDGIVKVLDFGLAKLSSPQMPAVDADPRREMVNSNPGVVMGTVQYMSPEQARGQDVDDRTDIWSLGVVLYEMVSGGAPFVGETPSHVIVSILESEPPPLAKNSDVPLELERIFAKALRKDRRGRYQTASELAQDLKSLKQEIEVDAVLKRSREANTDNGRVRIAGHVGVATWQESPTDTADVATARAISSAEYLVSEVRRRKRGLALVAASVLIAVVGLAYFFYPTRSGEAIDSLAVLPFVNESGDPNTEYLSKGISDSIINNLSRLSNLKVVSLNAALRYEGQQVDLQTIGRELDVEAVLMGRMTQREDGLAISAELVDVRDNRRLWGVQYNRKLSDVLAIEQEVAREIAETLRLRLDSTEEQRLTKQYTESADAYRAYLRGRYLLHKRTPQTTEKSIEYFEQAIKLDPDYAPAYATLADAHLSLAKLKSRLPEEVMPRAKAAADKALAIDDTLAEAHAAVGSIRFYEWDWSGAEREFKRAIDLNPNYERNNSDYEHYLLAMKRFDDALAESKRVLEHNPVSVHYNRNVAMILYFSRRYDEAIEQCQKTLELDPNMRTVYEWLAAAYEQKGLYDLSVSMNIRWRELSGASPEEVRSLREAYAASGWNGFWRKVFDLDEQNKQSVNTSWLAEIHARLGEKDQAFALLEKAYERRLMRMKFVNTDPVWDDLRSNPRYADLVRRMDLEP